MHRRCVCKVLDRFPNRHCRVRWVRSTPENIDLRLVETYAAKAHESIRHDCNYNPQQLDKIVTLVQEGIKTLFMAPLCN